MSFASAKSRIAAPLGVAALFLLAASFSPSHAAAQSVASQTTQLLPPGQNTCQSISVTNIQPYVYGGELESFDVTISDTSNAYVGAFAVVGNTEVPLNFITRWAGSPNGLRIHVDTFDTPVGSNLPINLTLLASIPGQPTCMTVITFDLTGQGTIGQYTAPNGPITQQQTSQNGSEPPATYVPPTSTTGQSSSGSSNHSTGNGHVSTTGNGSALSGAASTSAAGAVTSAQNAKFFSNICTGNNAFRLWFILLIIYILIVGIVVFAEPWFLEASVIGSTAAILLPLILLLAFWYFSDACRAASWIPVVACVIAIIGLFLAFREYELPPLLPAPPSEQ